MNSITKEFLLTGYESLLQFPISSLIDFQTWLRNRATFEAQIEEESGWRYIKTTTHTNDQDAQKAFEEFSTEWYPIIAEKAHQLNQKLLQCPFISEFHGICSVKNKSNGYCFHCFITIDCIRTNEFAIFINGDLILIEENILFAGCFIGIGDKHRNINLYSLHFFR